MGTMEITSSKLNKSYVYKNEDLVVNGNYQQNAESGALETISGTCYRKDAQGNQGDYVCNFNGYIRDEKMHYNMSDMSLDDTAIVVTAIGEIETWINENE